MKTKRWSGDFCLVEEYAQQKNARGKLSQQLNALNGVVCEWIYGKRCGTVSCLKWCCALRLWIWGKHFAIGEFDDTQAIRHGWVTVVSVGCFWVSWVIGDFRGVRMVVAMETRVWPAKSLLPGVIEIASEIRDKTRMLQLLALTSERASSWSAQSSPAASSHSQTRATVLGKHLLQSRRVSSFDDKPGHWIADCVQRSRSPLAQRQFHNFSLPFAPSSHLLRVNWLSSWSRSAQRCCKRQIFTRVFVRFVRWIVSTNNFVETLNA